MQDGRLPRGNLRKWLIRAAGSALVLGALLWWLPRDAVLAAIGKVPLWLFLGVFALFLAGHVAAAAKWWLLLDRAFAFAVALRAHFAGLAANLCLPGVAGGDAVRAALAYRAMGDGARLAAGSVADRLIDMLALACLALIGFLMLREEATGGAVVVQALGLMVAALVFTIWVAPRVLPALWARFPGLPARGLVEKLAAAARDLGRRPGLILAMLIVSTAIQAIFILLAWQLAKAAGVEVALGAWVFAWALAKLIVVLPISLGGLGMREAALAGLLVPFGAVAAEVVAAGLVWQAVLWLAGGLGALMLLVSGGVPRTRSHPVD